MVTKKIHKRYWRVIKLFNKGKKQNGGEPIAAFRSGFLQHTAMTDITYRKMINPVEEHIVELGIEKSLHDAVEAMCQQEHIISQGKKQAAVFLVYLTIANEKATLEKDSPNIVGYGHFELGRLSIFLDFIDMSQAGAEWLLKSKLIEDAWRFLRGSKSCFSDFSVKSHRPISTNESLVHVQDIEEDPITETERSEIENLLDEPSDVDPMSLIHIADNEEPTDISADDDTAPILSDELEEEQETDHPTSDGSGEKKPNELVSDDDPMAVLDKLLKRTP